MALRDPDGPDEPASALGDVFVQVDSGFLEITSVGNHGGMLVRHLDRIDLAGYRAEFPDDVPIPVAIGSHFLGGAFAVRCLRVEYTTDVDSDLARGVVRGLELFLEHGQRIVFDPLNTWGVRVGNTGAWPSRVQDGPWPVQRHTVSFSRSGPVRPPGAG
ncbi:hypothetical protein Aph02nite_10530 [Actinoplanes philippinensis]|nr:hypothetical protein Aph02nite_10530 [Actinoplanes philippinensis]